ncbi:hypothetical protein OsJ_30302 [Oryza sativa Japonica Group]|uniref:DUF1618 domain-containing protein n=1 Tax=Oryza sativa subsp. japonica TaxID=39947 RepID=B9G508_ORYSJ|nr:hypothetical protein OsJ_30302 [Oryza sativa Japonica Group]
MATVFPYRWTKTKHLTERPPTHGHPPDAHPWIVLDVRAYIADRQNATTATTSLTSGRKLQITICAAPPPLVSYVCAWSPNADPALVFAKEPVVACVNADLVFLRVHSDQVYHLVYHAGGGVSSAALPSSPAAVPGAGDDHDDDSTGFYVCSLDQELWYGLPGQRGHFKLCLYDSIDGEWSQETLRLDQLRNPQDKDTVFHYTEKVITLHDEQVVAFVDLWRGMVICNVNDGTCNNVELLPKLNGLPAMDKLRIARPMLSLMDSHVVYIMGKVNLSGEKAVVLTVDMANKRLQGVSLRDAERIVYDDNGCSYKQYTISQYFTTSAGD